MTLNLVIAITDDVPSLTFSDARLVAQAHKTFVLVSFKRFSFKGFVTYPPLAMASAKYGKISLFERLTLVSTFLLLPLAILWRLVRTQPQFEASVRPKSWRRVMADASFRYISSALNVSQMQAIMGTTLQVCQKWGKQHNVVIEVHDIGEGAKLIWFGERRTDKTILYIHGGTYCLPIQDFALSFWNHVRQELKRSHNLDIGFVALNYSLVPEGYFPTQVSQATLALNHLLSLGLDPANLQIVGESAGGGLILQLISHILHPAPFVPPVSAISQRLSSVILLSPWVSLTTDSPSFVSNSDSDVLPAYTWGYIGQKYLEHVDDSQRPYVEPLKAPQGWFSDIKNIIGRIKLVTGGKECLRDDVVEMSHVLKEVHSNVDFYVQEGGVHNDAYLDFLAGETVVSGLTVDIVKWLSEGF